MLELWHGPTNAFKDMALTILPRLMVLCKKKLGIKETSVILVATSGDTGKAALEGFKDVEGTKVCVFYPSEGVSNMQKLQMITQEGGNVGVFRRKGQFRRMPKRCLKGYFLIPKLLMLCQKKAAVCHRLILLIGEGFCRRLFIMFRHILT
jgi:hypothetical protein